MKLTLHVIDAFTSERFKGNSAAVVPLREWLPPALMQSIARENNLSETAFFVQAADGCHDIR
ncbi:PhzF family phenazine biosynthesis protein, partial [Leptospira sp. 96542]|nr:PhzF family phenazine biosynthesis protein [Leptospira sp. 96542]